MAGRGLGGAGCGWPVIDSEALLRAAPLLFSGAKAVAARWRSACAARLCGSCGAVEVRVFLFLCFWASDAAAAAVAARGCLARWRQGRAGM